VPRSRALRLLTLLVAASLAGCAMLSAPPAPQLLPFWRISREDGVGGSAHLLGSMHVAKSALALDPAIESALAEADEIALEVAPSELEPGKLLELVVALGQLPPGQSLAQLVSARTMRRLARRVAASGTPLAVWERWEPWLVSLMLANDELEGAGFSVESGIEPVVGATATRAGKPTRGLETAREQIERFDALPLETQELLLSDSLDPRRSRSEDSLEAAWRNGDLGALAREIFESPKGPAAAPYFESIYFARNRSFADDIAQLVDTGGRWFVAIGAGHMVGADGIPQLLAARGYRVERIAKTPASAAPAEAPDGAADAGTRE
jgi:hypothetical protein